MAVPVGRARVRSYSRGHDDPRSPRPLVAGLVPILGLVALAMVAPGLARGVNRPTVTISTSEVSGGAPNAVPAMVASAAADLLEQTTAKGGTGYRFEVLQRSTLVAKDGDPLIPIPDPSDRHKTLGETDHYEVASLRPRELQLVLREQCRIW